MKKLIYIMFLFLPVMASAQSYTLQKCLELAIKNSYDLKNSNLDFQMADQTRKEAFTKYFPSVSANGAAFDANNYFIDEKVDLTPFAAVFAHMGLDPATLGLPSSIPIKKINNGVVGLVSAVQPLYTGGQIINGNRLAKVGVDVSRLKISLSENEVISKTEEYFWQIVSLKEKLNTLDVVGRQLEELHKTAGAAVAAGVTTRNDLLRVELQQQNIESSRIKAENGIKVYKLLICNLTGLEKEGFDITVSDFSNVKNPDEYFIATKEGIKGRTETKLLEKSVEATSLQHKMAIGKNMPVVAAGAGYLYHNMLDKDAKIGMVFATVSIPLSSWWGGSHEIRREKYNQEKAENQKKNMEEMMAVDIETKWDQLVESFLQVQVSKKSIESATENLRISNDYYKAGTVSLTNLLEAQTLMQQSRDQYTDACTSYYLKLTPYLQATGRNSPVN